MPREKLNPVQWLREIWHNGDLTAADFYKAENALTAAEQAEQDPYPKRNKEQQEAYERHLEQRKQAEVALAARSGSVKVGDLVSIIALWSDDEGLDLLYGQGDDLARRILAALESAEPATDAEPVAWMKSRKSFDLDGEAFTSYEHTYQGAKGAFPVYTRPPESRLREAAERVVWFDWSGNDSDAVKAIDELRTALAQGADDERS